MHHKASRNNFIYPEKISSTQVWTRIDHNHSLQYIDEDEGMIEVHVSV